MGKNSEEKEKNAGRAKSRGTRGRHIIITAIITSMVVLAVIVIGFILPSLEQENNTLVGLWHITTVATLYNGTNISSPADMYIVFNYSGTGYMYRPYLYGATHENFTWHPAGHNVINVIEKSNKTKYEYSLNGDKLVLKSHYLSTTTIMYGVRVSKIPHIKEDLIVMLIYSPKSSNLTKGWVNFTIEAKNPEALEPEKVHICINDTEMKYSQKIIRDGEWSYVDLDHNGKITTGDIITVHSTKIAPNTMITLTYEGYKDSSSGMIPPPYK